MPLHYAAATHATPARRFARLGRNIRDNFSKMASPLWTDDLLRGKIRVGAGETIASRNGISIEQGGSG